MKFRVTWSIHTDKWLPLLKKWVSMFPQQRADAGDGVKIIGRWHDVAGRTGVLIVEFERPCCCAALHRALEPLHGLRAYACCR